MPLELAELDQFGQFARQALHDGQLCESLEEMVELWREHELSPEELQESVQAIRRGVQDAHAGRIRPATEVFEELRARYQSGGRS